MASDGATDSYHEPSLGSQFEEYILCLVRAMLVWEPWDTVNTHHRSLSDSELLRIVANEFKGINLGKGGIEKPKYYVCY
jgi:hypothetical protein